MYETEVVSVGAGAGIQARTREKGGSHHENVHRCARGRCARIPRRRVGGELCSTVAAALHDRLRPLAERRRHRAREGPRRDGSPLVRVDRRARRRPAIGSGQRRQERRGRELRRGGPGAEAAQPQRRPAGVRVSGDSHERSLRPRHDACCRGAGRGLHGQRGQGMRCGHRPRHDAPGHRTELRRGLQRLRSQ